jgi:hypothetical protein
MKLGVVWLLFAAVAITFWLVIRDGVTNLPSVVGKLSVAIAGAEGFYVQNSRPQRNNNPGDLTVDLTGKGTGKDSEGFVIYATPQDGWDALNKQVSLMFTGPSHFNSSMTIQEVADIYTATDSEYWANAVAWNLGVSKNTELKDLT